MNTLATTALIIGYIVTVSGFIAAIARVFKKVHAICDGQQCQLRNDITTIYYNHVDDATPTLREHERENLDALYNGYKALGGNSYIDDIYHAMRGWTVKA